MGLGDFQDYRTPKKLEQFVGMKIKEAKCGGKHSVLVTGNQKNKEKIGENHSINIFTKKFKKKNRTRGKK